MDAVVHCVGALVDGKTYETSYEGLNRDSCIRIAERFDEIARNRNQVLPFFMISSEKAPPFMSKYLTTKLEAEQFLVNECKNLRPVILRPGFIVSQSDRSWSVPLKYVVDITATLNSRIISQLPGGKCVDPLFPAHSTGLETISNVVY